MQFANAFSHTKQFHAQVESRTTAALDVLYMCVCVYYVYMSLYMCTMCVQATDSLETEL